MTEEKAAVPGLDPGAVHVWLGEAGELPDLSESSLSLLDPQELGRLARYRFPEDKARFAAGRAAVRRLLGAYAGIEPSAVRLVTTPFGRPVAAPGTPAAGIEFSVSHSGRRVLLAFTSELPVGVDVERPRPGLDIGGLVGRFFAPDEKEALLSLEAGRRAEAFLAVWTRKEAFIKATGQGLSCPLASFTVSVEADRPARLLAAPAGLDPKEWSILDVDAGPGYRSALAVRHPSPIVSLYRLSRFVAG